MNNFDNAKDKVLELGSNNPLHRESVLKRKSSKRNFFVNTNNRFDILHSGGGNGPSNPFKALGFATEGQNAYQHQNDTSGINTSYPNFVLTPESHSTLEVGYCYVGDFSLG